MLHQKNISEERKAKKNRNKLGKPHRDVAGGVGDDEQEETQFPQGLELKQIDDVQFLRPTTL